MDNKTDIIVVGAGASGLAAALEAARAGASVLVLEKNHVPGRKLLSTGSGKCNFSNRVVGPPDYNAPARPFLKKVFTALPPREVHAFFAGLGLLWSEGESGRLFPRSLRSQDVAALLCDELTFRGGRIATLTKVSSVKPAAGGFEVRARKVAPISPSIVPLRAVKYPPRELDGVRLEARLRLLVKGRVAAESAGELLFTDYGLSGPAALDLSRAAVAALAEGPAGQVKAFAAALKSFRTDIEAPLGFAEAMVTAGGCALAGIDPATFASKKAPGLHVTGELLDVDGRSGGFNLHFAWTSGILAGRAAARF